MNPHQLYYPVEERREPTKEELAAMQRTLAHELTRLHREMSQIVAPLRRARRFECFGLVLSALMIVLHAFTVTMGGVPAVGACLNILLNGAIFTWFARELKRTDAMIAHALTFEVIIIHDDDR